MKAAIKRVINILKWFGLMIFAIVVLVIFMIPSFIIGLVSKFWRKKIGTGLDEYGEDLHKLSFTLDLLGNVTIFNWLWFLFKTSNGYKFGNIRETISYVLHQNFKTKTLTKFGNFLYITIIYVDKKHFENIDL